MILFTRLPAKTNATMTASRAGNMAYDSHRHDWSAQCGHLKSTGKTSETESNEQKTNTYMEKMGVKERREHFFVAVKQEV